MDNLRWTLLVLGVVFVIVVYVMSRFNLWDKIFRKPAGKKPSSAGSRPRSAADHSFDGIEAHEEEISSFTVSNFEADISSFEADFDDDDYDDIGDEDWHEVMADSRKPADDKRSREEAEIPVLDMLVNVHDDDIDIEQDVATQSGQAELELDIQPLILSLTVMNMGGAGFDGVAIRQALEAEGLVHGDMDIFHYYPNEKSRAAFSIASVTEPGTFDLDKLDELLTPGIVLFCQLPGPLTPVETFKRMHDCAGNLAMRLHGRVCDDRRNAITAQSLAHYHERINTFNRELVLAQKK